MQTDYSLNQTAGTVGMPSDLRPSSVITAINEEAVAVPMGSFVVAGTAMAGAQKNRNALVPTAALLGAGGMELLGLALYTTRVALAGETSPAVVPADYEFSCMEYGSAYVDPEANWVEGDDVFVRFANGVAVPADVQKGAIRNDSDSGTAFKLYGAKFVNSGTAGTDVGEIVFDVRIHAAILEALGAGEVSTHTFAADDETISEATENPVVNLDLDGADRDGAILPVVAAIGTPLTLVNITTYDAEFAAASVSHITGADVFNKLRGGALAHFRSTGTAWAYQYGGLVQASGDADILANDAEIAVGSVHALELKPDAARTGIDLAKLTAIPNAVLDRHTVDLYNATAFDVSFTSSGNLQNPLLGTVIRAGGRASIMWSDDDDGWYGEGLEKARVSDTIDADDHTIETNGINFVELALDADHVGAIMSVANAVDGDSIKLHNITAFDLDFAVVATSNVAGSTDRPRIPAGKVVEFTFEGSVGDWTDEPGGLEKKDGATQAITANDSTIETTGLRESTVTADGAYTGQIIEAPAEDGQMFNLINGSGAQTLVFAAVGTSNFVPGAKTLAVSKEVLLIGYNGLWHCVDDTDLS